MEPHVSKNAQVYVWSDGSSSDFFKWQSGEPENTEYCCGWDWGFVCWDYCKYGKPTDHISMTSSGWEDKDDNSYRFLADRQHLRRFLPMKADLH